MQRMQCFIEMTMEQGDLSEAEEPEETSGTKDVVCVSLFVCPTIPSHCITGACDGHR